MKNRAHQKIKKQEKLLKAIELETAEIKKETAKIEMDIQKTETENLKKESKIKKLALITAVVVGITAIIAIITAVILLFETQPTPYYLEEHEPPTEVHEIDYEPYPDIYNDDEDKYVHGDFTFNYRPLFRVNQQANLEVMYSTVTYHTGVTLTSFNLHQNKETPPYGALMQREHRITDAGLVFIFTNGYNGEFWNSGILGGLTRDQQYQATQLAIWLYQFTLSPHSLDESDRVTQAAIALAEAARNSGSNEAAISISAPYNYFTLVDGYFKSTLLTVTGREYLNYIVTLICDGLHAQIFTTDGIILSSGAVLQAGTNFYVRFPVENVHASLNPIVEVNAVGRDIIINRFTIRPRDANVQDIAAIQSTIRNISAQMQLSLTLGSVSILSVSRETGQPLEGVTFKLYDTDNRLVYTWVSTATARRIDNLLFGIYRIEEISAPVGYILNTQATNFSITATSDNDRILRMYSRPVTP